MGIGKKLISNTIYLFLDYLVLSTLSLIFWVIAGKSLDREGLGIVATTINLILFISGITMFGIDSAVSKLIPEFLEKKKYKKIKLMLGSTLKFFLITNITISIFLLIFSNFFSSFLKIPPIAFVSAASVLIFATLSKFLGSVLLGFQNMRKITISDFIACMTRVIISIALVLLGFRHLGLIGGFIISVIMLTLLRIDRNWIEFGKVDKKLKSTIFKYATSAFLASIAVAIFANSQTLILSSIKDPKATGTFSIALTYTSPIPVLVSTLSSALFPIISQLSIDKSKTPVQSFLIQMVLRYSLLIVVPLSLILTFFSKPIILIFSNPDFLPATQIFPIMCLSGIFLGIGNLFLSSLYAMKKPVILRNISFARSLIFLIFSIWLAYFLSYIGVAIARVIAGIFTLFMGFYYLKKYIEVRFPISATLKILISSIPFFLLLFFSDLMEASILIKMLVALIGGVIYLICLIPLKFYTKEDVKLLEIFASKSPLFKKQVSILARFLSRYCD